MTRFITSIISLCEHAFRLSHCGIYEVNQVDTETPSRYVGSVIASHRRGNPVYAKRLQTSAKLEQLITSFLICAWPAVSKPLGEDWIATPTARNDGWM